FLPSRRFRLQLFFLHDPPTTSLYTLSLHDPLPILARNLPPTPRRPLNSPPPTTTRPGFLAATASPPSCWAFLTAVPSPTCTTLITGGKSMRRTFRMTGKFSIGSP